jgi:secondary thiamine-phosphate synthase enzyme
MVANYGIQIEADSHCDMLDITDKIEESIKKSGLVDGLVNIFVPGSTGGVTTIEYEPGLQKDFPDLMEKLVPSHKPYEHDKTWGDGNGFSHLRASLIGPSLTMPVISGKLQHGTWQQVVFLNFDNRPRTREIIITIMGD